MTVFSRIRAALKGSRDEPSVPAPEVGEVAPAVEPVAAPPAAPDRASAPASVPAPPPAAPTAPEAPVALPAAAGWAAELGLRSRIATGTARAEPHILWGTRRGRQVFIRLGVDEVGEGQETFTIRGMRQIVVVRAAFPTFELRGEDGRLIPAPGATTPPAAVLAVLAALEPAPDVWRDMGVVAGPEGIVTTRPQLGEGSEGWRHDLELAERLAAAMDAEPLLAERIGPAWKVPYGVAGKRRRTVT